MKSIEGKYKQFSFEEIEKYAGIDNRFKKLVGEIQASNNYEIPLDILTHIMGITSYTAFINNYKATITGRNELIHERVQSNMSKEIQDTMFSDNLKEQMLEYNIIPYKIERTELVFLTTEDTEINERDQLMVLHINSIMRTLGVVDLTRKIKVASNKTFNDGLRLILGKPMLEEKHILITEEERFNKIVIDGILQNASDIYVDPKKDGIDVSFSIFNDKVHYNKYLLPNIERINMLNSIILLAGFSPDTLDWKSSPSKQQRIRNLGSQDDRYEGRVNVLNTRLGVSSVIRIQDSMRSNQSLDKLKINEKPKRVLKRILENPNGILLVAGAKGQGKTTTCSSCIDYMFTTRPSDRIEEVGQPIEITDDRWSQISIDEEMGLDFAEFTEATTRRNAQIIFLGEINNSEATKALVNIAIQDTFVLSTVHSQSTSLIPGRIKGMVLEDEGTYLQFLELVIGMVHQIMLKEVCPDCSKDIETATLPTNQREILEAYGYTSDMIKVTDKDKKESCNTCKQLGYLVDKPIICVDILEVTDSVRQDIIKNSDNPRSAIEKIQRDEGIAGIQDALEYLEQGLVNFEQIWTRYSLWNTDKEIIMATRR